MGSLSSTMTTTFIFFRFLFSIPCSFSGTIMSGAVPPHEAAVVGVTNLVDSVRSGAASLPAQTVFDCVFNLSSSYEALDGGEESEGLEKGSDKRPQGEAVGPSKGSGSSLKKANAPPPPTGLLSLNNLTDIAVLLEVFACHCILPSLNGLLTDAAHGSVDVQVRVVKIRRRNPAVASLLFTLLQSLTPPRQIFFLVYDPRPMLMPLVPNSRCARFDRPNIRTFLRRSGPGR